MIIKENIPLPKIERKQRVSKYDAVYDKLEELEIGKTLQISAKDIADIGVTPATLKTTILHWSSKNKIPLIVRIEQMEFPGHHEVWVWRVEGNVARKPKLKKAA